MNKIFFLILSILVCSKISSQSKNTNVSFPHNRGDLFEYRYSEFGYPPDTLQVNTTSDSTDSEGNIYFTQTARFINPTATPILFPEFGEYKIDLNNNVWGPGLDGYGLVYRLDGKAGDSWFQVEGREYAKTRIDSVFQSEVFGHLTTVRVFTYYYWYSQYDSVTIGSDFVSSDFGVISRVAAEGPGQANIIGIVINGKLYGDTTLVSVKNENEETLPGEFTLYQNYPNPFNPSTKIKYQVSKAGLITLKVYDILGKEVETLVNDIREPRFYEVKFEARYLPSGVYIYRINNGETTITKKMQLIK
ncbi:T9SS type A sorting domain-containing protein [Stygiobacter electus]|uniref:T9SS type A sorting domain-containing protein n=1 Tax=Stygiobacter electus TaxID=3032292 RepID=A0AAE3P1U3_9BACT|nr:T9SS type A sorting domain-containing protein [Stygiobacter electus]MDF1612695.1 T9SS type A sorting domain-containing protein [Stygiobacter electus]